MLSPVISISSYSSIYDSDYMLFTLLNMQYQNCLRKFYHNTDSQVLLYLARTYYEAEQWQDCIKTLQRAIHLAPSNYTLRFDAGVAMQKFSASTLQKAKRTADEVVFFILFLLHLLILIKNIYR
jgi:tetratricopeptide (TPR) repeat protein